MPVTFAYYSSKLLRINASHFSNYPVPALATGKSPIRISCTGNRSFEITKLRCKSKEMMETLARGRSTLKCIRRNINGGCNPRKDYGRAVQRSIQVLALPPPRIAGVLAFGRARWAEQSTQQGVHGGGTAENTARHCDGNGGDEGVLRALPRDCYFPMQKREKIASNTSSGAMSPTSSARARQAASKRKPRISYGRPLRASSARARSSAWAWESAWA